METMEQYNQVVQQARDLFIRKTRDYGTSWRIFRPASLTDQLFIKANRIRTIQGTGENKVGESIEGEFVAIVNYSIMAIIQQHAAPDLELELTEQHALALYDEHALAIRNLMERKNHDYGEAWRSMRISSLTDLILSKLLRIKQIEDNKGVTEASEGAESNYMDIANYAIFALILMQNEQS
jgi:hypothetical protein